MAAMPSAEATTAASYTEASASDLPLACARAISAASILAKTSRDAELRRLDALYPEYGFARHKGYGTAEHLAALEMHGACPQHRRSFAPVARALQAPVAA